MRRYDFCRAAQIVYLRNHIIFIHFSLVNVVIMWEVDKNFNFKIYILIFSFRGVYLWATATTTMIFDDDDDDDDEGLHVTSQAKPIFFRNIGHFRNRRVESINNSSVWPPPAFIWSRAAGPCFQLEKLLSTSATAQNHSVFTFFSPSYS